MGMYPYDLVKETCMCGGVPPPPSVIFLKSYDFKQMIVESIHKYTNMSVVVTDWWFTPTSVSVKFAVTMIGDNPVALAASFIEVLQMDPKSVFSTFPGGI